MTLLIVLIGTFLPAIVGALLAYNHTRIPISNYKPGPGPKITTGRFKGKHLFHDWEVKNIEEEVFDNPVEKMLADINAKTYIDSSSRGSILALATIERLEEQIDPLCSCGNGHRTSGHEWYIKMVERRKQEKRKKIDEGYIEVYTYYTHEELGAKFYA